MVNQVIGSDEEFYLEAWSELHQKWEKPVAGLFAPARELAEKGAIQAALEEANNAMLENYGRSHGLFRVVAVRVTRYELSPCHKFSE